MSKATSFLGADPEVNGGLAIVAVTDRTAPVLVECIDIPVTGTGAKERVDANPIARLIGSHRSRSAARFERTRNRAWIASPIKSNPSVPGTICDFADRTEFVDRGLTRATTCTTG